MSADIHGPVALTGPETKLLTSILSHLTKADLEADWGAVAKDLNYKDATIAKIRWRQVKVKKFGAAVARKDTPSSSPDKASNKRKKPNHGEDADDGSRPMTPTKRNRKSNGGMKTEEGAQDEDMKVKVEDV